MSLGTAPLGTTPLGVDLVESSLTLDRVFASGENRILINYSESVLQVDPLGDTDALNPENYLVEDTDGNSYAVGWVKSVEGSEVELVLSNSLPDDTVCSVTLQNEIELEGGGAFAELDTRIFSSLVSLRSRVRENTSGKDFSTPMAAKDRPQGVMADSGGYGVDGEGDYLAGRSLRARLRMRLLTNKGDFAYAPNYGLEIEKYKGRLLTDDLYMTLAAEIKAQMLLEPDVKEVKVGFRAEGDVLVIIVTAKSDDETVTVEESFDWK